MNVLVTGGTGDVGRDVVVELRQAGHRARVLSRRPEGPDAVPGDLATGRGIEEAVQGMDAVIHAASATREQAKGRQVDVHGTQRLLDACERAGVGHLVYVSIVGMEGVAYPYYRIKLATEAVVKGGRTPWSILRATQFHNLMERLLGTFSKVPGVTAIPFDWKYQPVDTGEVARRLVEVALSRPGGMLPDFGGPEVRTFESIGRAWLSATRSGRRLLNMPVPTKSSRQFAAGRLLAPEHRDGKITFEQYLARRYPAP